MKFSNPARRSVFVVAALLLSGVALAANYPLELVSPRAAGTFPSTDAGTPAMPSGHRIFFAYPGIAYNIRAVVIAGAYPYTFSLSNAPSGMTIDPSTGEINWPNPQANATPTITVTDAEGTTRSSPWTIQVTTSAFKFVDSVNGSDSNAGTLAAPWATLARVKAAAAPADIVYFRTGVYTTLGMATEGTVSSDFNPPGNWQKVIFDGKTRLLAYPGENPVYDGGYIANQRQGNILGVGCTSTYPSYIEGFTLRNMYHMGIQFFSGGCDYPVWRNLQFNGPAIAVDGSNSAGIMSTNSMRDPTYYSAYQRVSQTSGDPGVFKMYSHKKHLWEDCDVRNSTRGPDQKMHVPRFEIRRCTIVNTSSGAQGGLIGNMQFGDDGEGESASGEIRFNLIDRRNVSSENWAVSLNQNGELAQIFVYRNTLIGEVVVHNASSVIGPYRIYQNVIINAEPGTKISYTGGSASDRVVIQDNLLGTMSNNIVDAQGRLTSAYQQYVGTRGHQLGTEIRPRPPTALAVQ